MARFIIAIALFAGLFFENAVLAADTNAPAAAPHQGKAKGKAKGKGKAASKQNVFKGKIEKLDRSNMTITVSDKDKSRVIAISSQTHITREGKPATLSDLTPGAMVSGKAKTDASGKEEAVDLKVKEAKDEKAGEEKPKAEKPAKKKKGAQ